MTEPMVSVIVPVYNVEQYLPQCVDSILSQTYQNLEIILVDDGSADGSGKICDEFQRTDQRVRVIHKSNGGLSDARNVGTAACGGVFVFYLDSDDYMEPNAISALLDRQRKYGADLVAGNYFYTYPDHEDTAEIFTNKTEEYGRRKAMALLMQGKLQTFAWGKLIRADIAKKYAFPVGKLFEDHFWTHLVFHQCETVVVDPEPLVHYRQRKESISYSFTLNRLDILDGWRERIAFLQREYPGLIKDYLVRCAEDSNNLAWLVLTRMRKEKTQAFADLRGFIREYELTETGTEKTRRCLSALEKNTVFYGAVAVCGRILGGWPCRK